MADKAKIFLSYARDDQGAVEGLYRELSDSGFEPCMDAKDILPGELWRTSIENDIGVKSLFDS